MNREIKFRGKSVKGQWHYGLLCNDKDKGSDYEWFISNSVGRPYAYGAIESTIGQFTGLKDKNGVDIYEGDIIKDYGQNSLCVIVYDQERAIFTRQFKVDGKNENLPFLSKSYQLLEVIDNIHDKPELLK